jgi:choice-of-anchor B domain-containing protein
MEFFMIKILILSLICSSVFANSQAVSTSKNALLESAIDLTGGAVKAKRGNDIWGWSDPQSEKEYVIMGLDSKTSFIDVTDVKNPIHLADLKTATRSSTWRDVKIYKHFAYVVSEASSHGLQIFDLHRLRAMDGKNVQNVKADARNRDFGSAHNIFINEDSGYAYAVGAKTCDGGLHIMDLKNPLDPKFVNCVGRGVYEIPTKHGDAYTHDVQCVIYHGPDINFLGQEICISSNEDTVNIVNVTDKNKPYQISAASYDGVKYTHQGWLTEDHQYFLLGDELDEKKFRTNTKTFIWDFSDLANPTNFAVFEHNSKAIDHNMYVKGNYVYQANYNAGFRILDLTNISSGIITEAGFVDTMPNDDGAVFEGVWSVFPYFDSGTVAISGINGTLYLTRPKLK